MSESESEEEEQVVQMFSMKKENNSNSESKESENVKENDMLSLNEADELKEHKQLKDLHKLDENFKDVGCSPWIVNICEAMGIKTPTPVQKMCIPAVLKGYDVMGMAQTGSGKTAAFALPILQKLSADPYGIFAVVLTPTRELAFQISEQFKAFGSSMGLRECVVVGGLGIIQQAVALQKRPHVVIATPGRLAAHISGTEPPKLNLVQFLVLDEADRLLEIGFEKDLNTILSALPKKRQNLLFSATMTSNLTTLSNIALKKPFFFQATANIVTVDSLTQEYLFIPSNVKTAYLTYVMKNFGPPSADAEENKGKTKGKKKRAVIADDDDNTAAEKVDRALSVIIFVSTCFMCQLVSDMLIELDIPCVALHSKMEQKRRLASLGKFRSGVVNVLIATDVASRGLDIPSVHLVINFDVPTAADDYVHRVGRTARAGRNGRAITLITQYDIELVQAIEGETGRKMVEMQGVDEDSVLLLLNKVSLATRVARMRLNESGFNEKLENIKKRKKEWKDAEMENEREKRGEEEIEEKKEIIKEKVKEKMSAQKPNKKSKKEASK